MQSYNEPQKHLYITNPEKRAKAAEVVVDILNKKVKELNESKKYPDKVFKEISKEEIDAWLNKEGQVDKFIKANQKEASCVATKGKASRNKYVEKAFNRSYFYSLEGKSQAECDEFMEKYNTKKGAKEYLHEQLVNLMENFDPTVIYDDYDKLAEEFRKNSADAIIAFTIDSSIDNQGIKINEHIKNVYKSAKVLFEDATHLQNANAIQLNPFNLIIPTDHPDLSILLDETVPEIITTFMGDKELSEGISQADVGAYVATYMSLVKYKEDSVKEMEAKKELIKDGLLTKNFVMNKTFTKDGKDISYQEAIEAKINGEKVGVRDYNLAEKDLIQKVLYNKPMTYISKENKLAAGEIKIDKERTIKYHKDYLDKLEDFSKKIVKTNSIFSKDTQQFKDMRDTLKDFAKDYKKFKSDLNKELKGLDKEARETKEFEKITEFFNNNKEKIQEVKTKTDDYITIKTEKNRLVIGAGKELSKRSEKRFDLAQNLSATISLEHLEIEYNDVPPTPYKPKLSGKRIEASIDSMNKVKEVSTVKEVDKTKEVENTKDLEQTKSK